MSDPSDDDMDKPLTKREALDVFLTKREALELFPTKQDVREMFANFLDAVMAHIDKRFEAMRLENASERAALRLENAAEHTATRSYLTTEIARHTAANAERNRTELVAIDDKYNGLPERVTKLEAAVFPAPPAKRQRRR